MGLWFLVRLSLAHWRSADSPVVSTVGNQSIAQLPDGRGDRVGSILYELRTSNPGARGKLIPALLDALASSSEQTIQQVRSTFQNELAGDTGIVEVLLEFVKEGKGKKRTLAVELLLAMSFQGTFSLPGPAAATFASVLENDPDPRVREAMAQLLARTGARQMDTAKAALAKSLKSDVESQVRLLCAMSLGTIGHEEYFGNNGSTIAALTQSLSGDSNDRVRSYSAYALGTMGEKAAPSVSALCSALKDNSADVRGSAMQSLGQIGPKAAKAVPFLIEVLDGPSESLPRGSARVLAATALRGIGQSAAPAVPALGKLLADPSTCVAAASALEKVGTAAAPAIPNLITLLGSADCHARNAAARCLGSLGSLSRAAIPALKTAALDNRSLTGGSCGQMAQKAAETAIRLIER